MKSRSRLYIFIGIIIGVLMASTNVLAYDTYTLENYAYFDPITSNPCDETNYWTIYNPGSTCYRFLVLDSEDTSS